MKYLLKFNENTFYNYQHDYYVKKNRIGDYHFEESFYELIDDDLAKLSISKGFKNNELEYELYLSIKNTDFSKLVTILMRIKKIIPAMLNRIKSEYINVELVDVELETFSIKEKKQAEYMGVVTILISQPIEIEDEKEIRSKWENENKSLVKLLTKLKNMMREEDPTIEFDERIDVNEGFGNILDIFWLSPYVGNPSILIARFDQNNDTHHIYKDNVESAIDDWIFRDEMDD